MENQQINRKHVICLAYFCAQQIRRNLKDRHANNLEAQMLLDKLAEYRFILGKEKFVSDELKEGCGYQKVPVSDFVKRIEKQYEGAISEMERILDTMFEVLLDD